jgi:hypothetical protein
MTANLARQMFDLMPRTSLCDCYSDCSGGTRDRFRTTIATGRKRKLGTSITTGIAATTDINVIRQAGVFASLQPRSFAGREEVARPSRFRAAELATTAEKRSRGPKEWILKIVVRGSQLEGQKPGIFVGGGARSIREFQAGCVSGTGQKSLTFRPLLGICRAIVDALLRFVLVVGDCSPKMCVVRGPWHIG